MARGREAESPMEMPKPAWKDIFLRVKDELADDQVSLIAGGIAFYGLLALFPAITAFVAIAGLLVEPNVVVEQASELAKALPEEAAKIVLDQMTAVAGSREGGLGLAAILGVLIAVYSASKGVDNMIRGLNVAYEESETRGFLQLKLVVISLTLGLLVGMIAMIALVAGVPVALAFLDGMPGAETAIALARWPLMLLLGFFGIMALYRWGPSRDPAKWRWLTPGAVIAIVLWVLATVGFALYVRYFGSYNETFGTLSGVIILLMWLWISAFVLLLGAEVDAEIEAQTARDTTVGPREPRGRRGAVKADELGEIKSA